MPWQARAREVVQRVGLDPRYLRRLRWMQKAKSVRHSRASLRTNLRFVMLDPEPDNFTYEIGNLPELAAWAARVRGIGLERAGTLIAEPAADPILNDRLRAATRGHWAWSKRAPAFGKRLGWYALARAARPRLIVEVGVHDGLGSLLLLRALERNLEEGHRGRLVSFDVNPKAGWLVGAHPLWDLRIHSSGAGLARLVRQAEPLDLFIYDGWHSYDHERADLETAVAHLAAGGVLLSDDEQVTGALTDVCRESGLRYLEFHEEPIRHFYPGSVLAAGWREGA